MKRLLVTGSRDWTNKTLVEMALEDARHFLGEDTVLVHGGAVGADTICANVWSKWGLPVEKHPANWGKHGRAAGPIRNQEMVDLGADLCVGFVLPYPKGRGTRDCLKRASEAGIECYIWEADN